MTKVEIARLLGIDQQLFCDILGERKPFSPKAAARLGRAFGISLPFWIRMQGAFEARKAEREVDVSGMPKLAPEESFLARDN